MLPRRGGRFARACLLFGFAVAGTLTLGSVVSAQEAWDMAGADPAHTGTADGPAPPFRVAWRAELESSPVAGVVATSELVVVVTRDGIAALDATDGSGVWERGRPPGPAGVPAIASGLVLHARDEGVGGQLVARDLATGDIAWQAAVGAAAVGGPTVLGDLVVVGTARGEVVALDLQDGKELWRFETRGGVAAAPSVEGGTVVVVAYERRTARSTVYALSSDAQAEERVLWRHAPVSLGPSSGAAIAAGRVFVATSDVEVRAVELVDGEEVWTMPLRRRAGARQLPAAATPVLVADQAYLSALDPRTGEERWSWLLADLAPLDDGRLDSLLASSPALSGSTALIGGGTGTLSAIDAESGLRVWRADIGTGPVGPVAVTADRVYAAVLGEDGSVVALEHDPAQRLISEISPTVLDLGEALLNFAAAATGVTVVLLFVARLVGRRPEQA